ncbi:MAG: hypothetical protein KAI45_04100, partial [Melioribacteraceae bacterium]|nr:hypothetical protein [Melioribacteraceae bacterium]
RQSFSRNLTKNSRFRVKTSRNDTLKEVIQSLLLLMNKNSIWLEITYYFLYEKFTFKKGLK